MVIEDWVESNLACNQMSQSQVWLQKELDNTKSCYQLIITVTVSENNNYIYV